MMSVRACILGCSGTRLTESELSFFRDCNPFGFILFSRNFGSRDDVRRLTERLRATVGRSVPVLVDQEGGRVQRGRGEGWSNWQPPLEQCDRLQPDQSVRAMWLRYRIISSELLSVGIDANCVPVADIATDHTHPVLYNRCYGRSAELVSRNARAVADGCLDAGVLPVLKHIPGHGRPHGDSHTELPFTDTEKPVLAESDFLPFRSLRDLPMGMAAHVVFGSIDSKHTASQSRIVIDVIRNEIEFDGLLMTDDISMSALTGTMRQRCRKSLDAGCDLVLHCNGDLAEMVELAEEAGSLEGIAERRAKTALDAKKKTAGVDQRSLELEYERLVGKWMN